MATEFSEVFSKLRREKGISQRAAARDLGVSQALLSHYENGVREPRLDFIVRLCDYFGVSADYLLGRTGMKTNPNTVLASGTSGADAADALTAAACLAELTASALGQECVEDLSACMRAAEYKLYIRLKDIEGARDGAEPEERCSPQTCEAAMRIAEARIAARLEKSRTRAVSGAAEVAVSAHREELDRLMERTERELTQLRERW